MNTERVETVGSGTEYEAAEKFVNEVLDVAEEFATAMKETMDNINLQIEELEQEKEEWRDTARYMHSKLQEWFGEDMIPGHIE